MASQKRQTIKLLSSATSSNYEQLLNSANYWGCKRGYYQPLEPLKNGSVLNKTLNFFSIDLRFVWSLQYLGKLTDSCVEDWFPSRWPIWMAYISRWSQLSTIPGMILPVSGVYKSHLIILTSNLHRLTTPLCKSNSTAAWSIMLGSLLREGNKKSGQTNEIEPWHSFLLDSFRLKQTREAFAFERIRYCTGEMSKIFDMITLNTTFAKKTNTTLIDRHDSGDTVDGRNRLTSWYCRW